MKHIEWPDQVKENAVKFGRVYKTQLIYEKATCIVEELYERNIWQMPKYPEALTHSFDEHLEMYGFCTVLDEDLWEPEYAEVLQKQCAIEPLQEFEEYVTWLYDNQQLLGTYEVIAEFPCPHCGHQMPLELYLDTSGGSMELISDENVICYHCHKAWKMEPTLSVKFSEVERLDKTINLCDTCKEHFAVCFNGVEGEDFFFGNGVGNDNVYKCKAYVEREVNND